MTLSERIQKAREQREAEKIAEYVAAMRRRADERRGCIVEGGTRGL